MCLFFEQSLKTEVIQRRLLYVACTRARALLYLLYSSKRQVAGKLSDKSLSEFISVPFKKNGVRLFYSHWMFNLMIVRNFSIPMYRALKTPIVLSFAKSSIERIRMRLRLNEEFRSCPCTVQSFHLQHVDVTFREQSRDYVQPTYQTSYSAIKSSVHDVAVNGCKFVFRNRLIWDCSDIFSEFCNTVRGSRCPWNNFCEFHEGLQPSGPIWPKI